jgi:DNA-directed RNA polymerase specialized sigma subunit
MNQTAYTAPVTKDRLRSYRRLLIEIESQKDRIMRLTAQAEYAAASYSLALSADAANNDKLTEYLIQKEKLTIAYFNNLTRLATDAAEIEHAIDALTDTRERQTITLYYIDGLNWYKVAERMRYSVDHIYTIHGQALKKLYEITKDNSSCQ